MARASYLVGIDEVGRGPLAGPVTVCAFAVPDTKVSKSHLHKLLSYDTHGNLKDSKKMSEPERHVSSSNIRTFTKINPTFRFAISSVSANIIDRRGISKAVFLAITRSLGRLGISPEISKVFLDGGIRAPKEYVFQKTIIKGDQKIPVIALASIIAKVHRDGKMRRLAKKFPGYKFEEHKGYGTAVHQRALKKLGLSDIHRRSFLKGFALALPAKSP